MSYNSFPIPFIQGSYKHSTESHTFFLLPFRQFGMLFPPVSCNFMKHIGN
uniref:Uncharacterized protein n=1 Tax=Rhizophora mucronata TaxID=61149 RepID=A0A2P2MXU3_RHIMU